MSSGIHLAGSVPALSQRHSTVAMALVLALTLRRPGSIPAP